MRCPVCRTEYCENDSSCRNCGFHDLHKVFLNDEDAIEWQNEIVIPYRNKWKKTLPTMKEDDNFKKQIDTYIDYTSMCNMLEQNPDNDSVRSKLIDHLHQIWIYRNNYPISNRQRLFDEIFSHIDYFEQKHKKNKSIRLKYTFLNYIETKSEIYLSDGKVDQTLECYFLFLNNDLFIEDLEFLKNNVDLFPLVYRNLYYMILHNCSTICKIIGLPGLSEEFEEIMLEIDENKYTSHNRSYDYLYFNGMQINIQSPFGSGDINTYLSTKGNVRKQKCTYDQCIFKTSGESLFHCTFQDVPWWGHQCDIYLIDGRWQIANVNDDLVLNLTIEDKFNIMETCKKIISLF